MVDLRLASTYVPALTCLIRTSMVLLLISRESITRSTPALIGTGLALYLDRIVRQEVIFDSSALTCTIFVAHVLNLCRPSSGAVLFEKPRAAAAQARLQAMDSVVLFETRPSVSTSSPLIADGNATLFTSPPPPPPLPEFVKRRPALLPGQPSSSWWSGGGRTSTSSSSSSPLPPWYADLVYLIYIAASIMQIIDVDPVGMLCPSYSCTNQYLGAIAPSGSDADNAQALGHAAAALGDPEAGHHHNHLHHPGSAASSAAPSASSTATTYDHRQSAGFRRWYDYHRVLRALELGPSFSTARGSAAGAPACTGAATMGGTGNSNVVRISTVVTHCILAGLAMQVRVADADAFMAPARILTRGFVFYALCVAWTYAVGIRDACISIRAYPYYVNPMAQPAMPWNVNNKPASCEKDDDDDENDAVTDRLAAVLPPYVQPFTPCQLRFAVLLFADRWHFLAAALGSGLIVGERIHRAAFSCGQNAHHHHHPANNHAPLLSARGTATMSPSEEHESNVRRLRTQKRKNVVRMQHQHHHPPASQQQETSSSSSVSSVERGGSSSSDAHLFQLAFAGASVSTALPSPLQFTAAPPSSAYVVPSQLLSGIVPRVEEYAEEEEDDDDEEESNNNKDEDEDQLARMFRMARQQQQRQLGEMI